MNIGFIGLGKLGLPCALAIEAQGHKVKGYDTSEEVINILKDRIIPYQEEGAQALLTSSHIEILPLQKLIDFADILFVAVQTPHHPQYEGITRIPSTRADFDYTFLRNSIMDISSKVDKLGKSQIVVVISTVLPGTIESEILPILSPLIKLCYNPFFIAMGTTIYDFLNPEFILLGVDDKEAAGTVKAFYRSVTRSRVFSTSVKNAEAIKVFYNTYITSKIVFANTIMEICHKTGCDVDVIIDALSQGTDRIISPKYMRGGMGDGGNCHPRDNIALSWLAEKLDLSFDLFGILMAAREKQTEWLADKIVEIYMREKYLIREMRIIILGKAFKSDVNIEGGSPSILLKNILEERGVKVKMYDPFIDQGKGFALTPAIYFIGTNHTIFKSYRFQPGSIVIDPWRFIKDQEGVEVIRIGEGK